MAPPENENTEVRNIVDEGVYPCLEVLSGPKGGGLFALRIGKNTVGRSCENEIVLDDSSVSRRHAVIDVAKNGATIADLGSRNGTKISGQKISQAILLQHKMRIKIGAYQLRFLTARVLPGEEEPPPDTEPDEIPVSDLPSSPQIPAVSESAQLPAELLRGGEVVPVREEGQAASRGTALATAREGSQKNKKLFYLIAGVGLIAVVVLAVPVALRFTKGGKKGGEKKTIAERGRPLVEKEGQVGGVLPAETLPVVPDKSPSVQPVFLDFSSSPIPAQVFFGNQMIGVTPARISTNLFYGKWYEARAVFQLPEVGEAIEEKSQFSPPQGTTVMPVNFAGKIGVFKVAGLPKNTQLYLEGYFEKDPYRAKPIKFAEIVFGKPIYVPAGRYILELRRSRQLGQSQTYLDEVIYRREFFINDLQTSYTIDVNEEGLKVFPVQITSIPPGAKVFVDEKDVGVTPYNGSFPVGEHLLTLKREGFFDFVQVVKMEINMPYVAEIQLKTSASGELVNKADALMKENRYPEALPVLVEAFSKNPSPIETAQISYMVGVCYLKQKMYKEAQDYLLKAMQHDDYKFPARLGIATVTLEQGDTMKALQFLVEVLVSSEDAKVRTDAGALFQRISPLKSVLYITSEPSGARVFVNGTEVAEKTPLILHDVGVGSYRIQFRKDGFQDEEIKLNLGVSEFRPVVAKLRLQ